MNGYYYTIEKNVAELGDLCKIIDSMYRRSNTGTDLIHMLLSDSKIKIEFGNPIDEKLLKKVIKSTETLIDLWNEAHNLLKEMARIQHCVSTGNYRDEENENRRTDTKKVSRRGKKA